MENWHFSTEVEDMGFDETSCKFYLFITELKSLFYTYIYIVKHLSRVIVMSG